MPTGVNFVYELIMEGVQDGQAIINVLHYRIQPGGANEELDTPRALAEALFERWNATFKTIQSEQYELRGITGREYTLAEPMPPDANHSKPWTKLTVDEMGYYAPEDPALGAVIGDPLPTFVGANYRKITGFGSRYWRGSFRLGGLVEANTVGSNWLPGFIDTLTTKGNSFAAPLQTGLGALNFYEMVVFSPQSIRIDPNPAPIAPMALTRTVSSFQPNVFPTSQVSRKKKSAGA